MPRPEKERRVASPPVYADFKPSRVPKRLLETIDLSLDEYEAIRLSDYMGLDHGACAEKMGVSRPTFTRLREKAANKVARFLIEGMNLSIGGGTIHFRENLFQCGDCQKVFSAAMGSKRSVCPSCSSENIENLAARYGHGDCCKPGRRKS